MTVLLGLPARSGAGDQPGGKNFRTRSSGIQENTSFVVADALGCFFFTGSLWLLALDGRITRSRGIVLIGLFACWQAFHIQNCDQKTDAEQRTLWLADRLGFNSSGSGRLRHLCQRRVARSLALDYSKRIYTAPNIWGWLSGWLMVLPNGCSHFTTPWQRRPEITYTSQIGDNHICIPLCVGLYALFSSNPPASALQCGSWDHPSRNRGAPLLCRSIRAAAQI